MLCAFAVKVETIAQMVGGGVVEKPAFVVSVDRIAFSEPQGVVRVNDRLEVDWICVVADRGYAAVSNSFLRVHLVQQRLPAADKAPLSSFHLFLL